MQKEKLKVLITASECAPFVKVGGLADVIGSLPKALKELGVDVRVVIPLYEKIRNSKFPPDSLRDSKRAGEIRNGNSNFKVKFEGTEEVGVYESKLPDSEVPIYFLENQKYLSGGGVYMSKDAVASEQGEIKRFAFFSRALVNFQFSIFNFQFDIVHCNDWHTGLVPGLLRATKPATVFTIHNLANQGFSDLSVLKNFDSVTSESELIKWDAADDNLDLMLQGITAADVVSTVSPTYAKEILTPEFGEGLHEVLKAREGRLSGILNGIDPLVWNPATDSKIEFAYSSKEGLAGKVANKIYLQKELGLKVDPGVPLIGMVTRLAEQKGFDLVLEVLKDILGLGAQLVILGVGDEALEEELRIRDKELGDEGNFSFINRFDEELAHKIYAASDLFLMPSKFEPCGLVQIIAMRYGALPIVRATGGLKDTVEDAETGFVFKEPSSEALLEAVERAVGRFGVENIQFRQMIAKAMRQDFSWEASAEKYLQLYRRAIEYREEEASL